MKPNQKKNEKNAYFTRFHANTIYKHNQTMQFYNSKTHVDTVFTYISSMKHHRLQLLF